MEVPTYAVFFKVHNKQRPVPRPRISPSRYLYVKEWEAAQAAWDQDAELRPSMDHILETLESQNNSQKYIKARVKVVCEQMPACSGYVSRSLDEDFGSQQVTQAIEESLIVAWDPDDQNPQVVYMLVGPPFLHLVALFRVQPPPTRHPSHPTRTVNKTILYLPSGLTKTLQIISKINFCRFSSSK